MAISCVPEEKIGFRADRVLDRYLEWAHYEKKSSLDNPPDSKFEHCALL